MKLYSRNAGLRVAAVHSGESSDPRTHSLERLQRGELDVLFAVDMFNEGVDLPDVDTILMLRPTESQILWLQQFGRGLRYRPEKRLKVIDYIGNHRSFLLKPRTLFQLEGGDVGILRALNMLDSGNAAELLPPNCSVTYDLEAKNILRELIGADRQNVGDRLRLPIDFAESLASHFPRFRTRRRSPRSSLFGNGLSSECRPLTERRRARVRRTAKCWTTETPLYGESLEDHAVAVRTPRPESTAHLRRSPSQLLNGVARRTWPRVMSSFMGATTLSGDPRPSDSPPNTA
jgi:hypothetical protein